MPLSVTLSKYTISDEDILQIVDYLVATGLFDSKSEARRNVEQGGIQIDNEKITDKEFVVSKAEHMVQKGKKTFLRVVVK